MRRGRVVLDGWNHDDRGRVQDEAVLLGIRKALERLLD